MVKIEKIRVNLPSRSFSGGGSVDKPSWFFAVNNYFAAENTEDWGGFIILNS